MADDEYLDRGYPRHFNRLVNAKHVINVDIRFRYLCLCGTYDTVENIAEATGLPPSDIPIVPMRLCIPNGTPIHHLEPVRVARLPPPQLDRLERKALDGQVSVGTVGIAPLGADKRDDIAWVIGTKTLTLSMKVLMNQDADTDD